jgi:hypothetical protein
LDFGSSDAGEGNVGNALTSLFVTPATCPDDTMLALFEFGPSESGVLAPSRLPVDRPVQVALAFESRSAQRLYLDGALLVEGPTDRALSELDDVNNWLGRSQWRQDLALAGKYYEFRIYDMALTTEQIQAAYARGPDGD